MNVYNIELRYKKGSENQGANFLSRHAIFEFRQSDRFTDIRKFQSADIITNSIINFLTKNKLPDTEELQKMVLTFSSRCFINDEVLWFVPPRASRSAAVLFTPSSMVSTILNNAHGPPLAGHWGVERTIARIQLSYFWPTMSQDVTKFVVNCVPCQKAGRPPRPAELTPWVQASAPNERIHIDLYGPLQGDPVYKYVAAMTCAFTKWTEVVPLINKEAPTVAKAVFEEWICRRGVMHLLVSDGGKEFANEILKELCKLMKLNKHVVSPYHPMANGQVERFNKDMKKYLMTMIDDTADWATYLKPLQFAHNTAINKSTMYTPHYLTFLQDPRLPDTITKPTLTYSPTYAADAFRRLQYAYNLVYKNNEEARQAYTANFNKKSRTRKFDIGDEVLVTFPVHAKTINKKLAFIWRGPYRIISSQIISSN
jgi:hypothetical protein